MPFDFGLKDLIDILLVAMMLYYIYRLMKESRSLNVFSGILIFVVVWLFVSQVLEMKLLGSIMDKLVSVGVIALIVLFQEEIRKFLYSLGAHQRFKSLYSFFTNSNKKEQEEDKETIMPIVLACMNMSRQKVGALIVIERGAPLDDIVDTGDRIDANINQRLIENIFFKNSPLHDGAVVISNKRIRAAACILPVSKVVIETAEFDLQRLKAMEQGKPLPVGIDYQMGEMYDYYNVRQYILHRDGYTCQCCGKQQKEDTRFHIHHTETRKTGGNAPDNLITLCDKCHKALHEGKIKLPETAMKRRPTRDAAFMGIMRKTLLERLRDTLTVPVWETSGYITKYIREKNGIPKTHTSDARCIAGCPAAKPLEETILKIPVRCHNRQIHKASILKGGIRKRNQAEYRVFGFRRWDKVRYNGTECFIKGRRSSGYFALTKLDGTVVTNSASYKKLKLLETAKHYLTERQVSSSPPMTEVTGVRADTA